ncbi:MAG: LysR family transcriptional regulator [Coriobacteriales bacterium]|nr:LysR family transcriptional regulator [Coriobacteriales bacterium]
MTLQQLRYLIAIAEYGSINAAAYNLYASQSNLSTAIRDLERELKINIFKRSNRGVTLTSEGTELLGYARQVVEQVNMLENRYTKGDAGRMRLAVSAQHYAFSVQAFVDVIQQCNTDDYEFVMRETSTGQIIDDVGSFRSEIGILFVDDFNKRVLHKAFEDASLTFHPLFDAQIHVFVGESHPLASHEVVEPEELEPWPYLTFEQGSYNSFYFSEEPLSYLPHRRLIRVSDRGTITSLLTHHNGYLLSTGVLSDEMQTGIVSIPLNTDKRMRVGYLIHKERKPGYLLQSYIKRLSDIVRNNPNVQAYLGD